MTGRAHCTLPPSSGSFPSCSALQRHPSKYCAGFGILKHFVVPFISLTYHPVSILVNSKSFHRSNLRTILIPCCLVAQFCPILCDPVDCSPPGSPVHGSSQARILEWVAISFSRGSSQPWDGTHISCIGRQIPTEPAGKPILVPSYCLLNRPRASPVAQTGKNLPAMWETRV